MWDRQSPPRRIIIIDEVSQVNKLLMTLVVIVIVLVKPQLNVVIGGDARQIPCPPEYKNTQHAFFFESVLWQLLGVRFCEVTQYLRDPAIARIVEALADGQNTPMVYHHLLPRFEDQPGAVVPPGATKLHVFARNSHRNDWNVQAFGAGMVAAGSPPTRIPWFVGTPPNPRRDDLYVDAFEHTLHMIECSVHRNCGVDPGTEGFHCNPWVDAYKGMRVIFSHSCECFDHVQNVPGSTVTTGPRRQVGKGQLGEIVGLEEVPSAVFHQWLAANVQSGAVGWGCTYGIHPGAVPPGGGKDRQQGPHRTPGAAGHTAAAAAPAAAVFWPVVLFRNKHGKEARVVVPHMTVRESRWKGKAKATAAVAFVPLHLGYAVNCQQMQGMTVKDRLLYLVADITSGYWLQGLAAVMVTRTTDLARLLFKVPAIPWARYKPNWFLVGPIVLGWLRKCRQSGFASGHEAGVQDVDWSTRKQRVCDKVVELQNCTLDVLGGSADQMRDWEKKFLAAGGVRAVAD
jgi:hypothetical protein